MPSELDQSMLTEREHAAMEHMKSFGTEFGIGAGEVVAIVGGAALVGVGANYLWYHHSLVSPAETAQACATDLAAFEAQTAKAKPGSPESTGQKPDGTFQTSSACMSPDVTGNPNYLKTDAKSFAGMHEQQGVTVIVTDNGFQTLKPSSELTAVATANVDSGNKEIADNVGKAAKIGAIPGILLAGATLVATARKRHWFGIGTRQKTPKPPKPPKPDKQPGPSAPGEGPQPTRRNPMAAAGTESSLAASAADPSRTVASKRG